MKTLWNATDRDELKSRLGKLGGQKPLWGAMDSGQMTTHCADAFRMALGELNVTGKRLPVRFTPLKQIMIYIVPWPHGLPTAPELLARESVGLEAGVKELEGLIDRMATQPRNRAWPRHPAFGKLSYRTWGVLGYKHLDHHLRQFGV